MPKLKYIGSVKAVADVIGEAYCQRCATVRSSGDVKVSLIPAMWGTGLDLRGVANSYDWVGFAARYRRYQPHASVLHHWAPIQAGMSFCLVCWENVGKERKPVSGCWVVFLFWDSNMWRSLCLLCKIVVSCKFWVWGFFFFLLFIYFWYIIEQANGDQLNWNYGLCLTATDW